MASQTFYPNGGIYPYSKLNYLRYDGNTGGEFFLWPGNFFKASGTTTFEHDTLIIKIKCRNETLTQTDHGWLTFSWYDPSVRPMFYNAVVELINNYDSETNKLDIFTYYTVPNNVDFSYAEAQHVYLENINSADILDKDIEFTFKFTVNSKATYDDPPSWDINISGKINNNEITPILLENIPLRIAVDPYSDLNRGQVLSSLSGKIGKLYLIDLSTITNNVETLIGKFTPCWQKNWSRIMLFNELYITPSPGTRSAIYPSMILYYWTALGNIARYTDETYNLQSSDIQWYNWRTSARNGIIIP